MQYYEESDKKKDDDKKEVDSKHAKDNAIHVLEKIKNYKRWLTPDKLVMGVLIGALLLVIALPTENADKKDQTSGEKETTAAGEDSNTAGAKNAQTDDIYCRQLEVKLQDMLMQVEGVGKTEVMITLESSSEAVLNKDNPYERENIEETKDGSTKQTHSYKSEQETVMSNVGGDQLPYVVKSIYPKIQGVVIVAKGAKEPSIKNEIIEAVEVLFGVEPHKVKVLGME